MAGQRTRGVLPFPNGARFAFTVMDDTDDATVENVGPLYELLESLGMRTTKTVWPVDCPEGSAHFFLGETLDSPAYLDFVLGLKRKGFEIAFHCATMESSRRERTLIALSRFQELFGTAPRVHANHSTNRENLYWGADRIDNPILRFLYHVSLRKPRDFYLGHQPDSEFWWGDVCAQQIEYVRNLTFSDINVLNANPSMPYRDPRRPHVRSWFSASDAENADEFVELMNEKDQQRLEDEQGVCIVATHFGKGFCEAGRVRDDVRAVLTSLAARRGWFVPVGPLLDFLAMQRPIETLPPSEWRSMQWRWARDLVRRRFHAQRTITSHVSPTPSP